MTASDYLALIARHDYAIVDLFKLFPEPWHEEFPIVRLLLNLKREYNRFAPGLLSLKALDGKQLERLDKNQKLAETGGEQRLIANLFTAPGASEKKVEAHLKVLNIPDVPEPEGKTWLGYYDPRAFLHILRVMDTPSLRCFYGPIQTWTVFINDEWREFTKPEHERTPAWWHLSAEQWLRLSRTGIINMALAKHKANTALTWQDIDEFNALSEQADRAIVIAQVNYHLKTPNDLSEFAMHSLLYGENFHRHPRIQHLLEEVRIRGEASSYADATRARMRKEDWASVAAESPSL